MNDDELIAARKAKTHPFGSDCSAKCLEDSLADRLEVLSTPEPDYRAALIIARDAWSRIDRLGNRPEDRVALDRAFDVLAATPEPEPSDEPEPKPTTLFEAIYLWHGIDFNTQGGLTMRDAESLLGAVLAVAPVEVTRDELVDVVYEVLFGQTISRQVADAIQEQFRVSRRDGEDKNND